MHKRPLSGESTLSRRDLPAGSVPASEDAARPSRQPVVRYVGFRSTDRGREYTMSVSEIGSRRDFVLLIRHEAFASRETRFQDAPDVCSAKLRRALADDPQLPTADSILVTAQDLLDYRDDHLSPLEKRSRNRG